MNRNICSKDELKTPILTARYEDFKRWEGTTANWASIRIKRNIVNGHKSHLKHIIERIIDKNAE